MPKSCIVEGCRNDLFTAKYCGAHYYRLRKYGDINKLVRQKGGICKVDQCNSISFALGLCPKHHRRFKRHGDPLFINPKCNRDGKYKERHKGYQKEWRKRNWESYRAYLNSRKKRMKMATPKWADLDAIRNFYLKCPQGYHVDHIIPLNGKNVSGLHVIENLQYLPAKENLIKGNKFHS